MAPLATDFILMYFMGNLIFSVLVARFALRAILDFLLGIVHLAVPVQFTLFVAINTHHPFLVVDIRSSSEFTGKFRINTSAVTRGAGFAFIFLDKLMAGNQAGGNSGNGRRLDMTITAGGMATPAGLIKYFGVEGF